MAKLFANSGDPDQTPRFAASDLVCIFCQLPFYGSPDYIGLKATGTPGRFSTMLNKGDICDFLLICFSANQAPSEKETAFKRK